MNKIIFVGFSKLNDNLYDALCIQYFIDCGLEVDYLDVTSLLFNGKKIQQNYDFIQSISNYKELEQYLILNNSGVLYNVQIHYETRFLKLFMLFKKYNCRISTFEIGYLPNLKEDSKFLKYLKIGIIQSL